MPIGEEDGAITNLPCGIRVSPLLHGSVAYVPFRQRLGSWHNKTLKCPATQREKLVVRYVCHRASALRSPIGAKFL
jgi:hypothetical protein